MEQAGVDSLLDEFRVKRREFQSRLMAAPPDQWMNPPVPDEWSLRDCVVLMAAWLNEANDRIPRLLAGAPSMSYEVEAFNSAALARAAQWTPEQALGAFRRAADRFEAIVGESDPADIADSAHALAWLTTSARDVINGQFDGIDRFAGQGGR